MHCNNRHSLRGPGRVRCSPPPRRGRRRPRTWIEADYSDFEKGIIHNLSLRSDGRLTLAPRFQELYDTNSRLPLGAGAGLQGQPLRRAAARARSSTACLPRAKRRCWRSSRAWKSTPSRWIRRTALYAATSPDGKVYRITSAGKPEVFYDPKAKYIWAMAFDSKGNLFVATGDGGEIHRVTPDGKGARVLPHRRDARALDGRGCARTT